MGGFLLSIASPEALSGAGFLLLAIAVVGQVAIFTIPGEKTGAVQFAGISFALLAALGFAVGHVGDDEIIRQLELRAEKAEKQIAWRRLSKVQHDTIVEALKGYEFDLSVWGMRAENDPEAHTLWLDIVNTLKDTKLKIVPATILASGQGVSVTPVLGPELNALRAAFKKVESSFSTQLVILPTIRNWNC